MDANARENVKCLILFAKIIKNVTTEVFVRIKLNYVFAKILTNVSMVLNAKAIRIVAKKAGAILNLDAYAKIITNVFRVLHAIVKKIVAKEAYVILDSDACAKMINFP